MSTTFPACAVCGSSILERAGYCSTCGTPIPPGRETAVDAAGSRQPGQPEFAGTDQFQLLKRLGAGSMGVVYAAFDRQRGETVALKTLFDRDSAAVFRLKQEFRALADLTHPNLVVLYELIAQPGDWFFTMELVDGIDLLSYVSKPELNIGRLRGVLRQLVEGLSTLHTARKLHRDLKPSNVLVTTSGRVVILDFGIAGDLDTQHGRPTERGLVGTLAYMAPEQVEGRIDEASDWYAVGVMLYEALTGRLPYTGNAYEILNEKRTRDPERPDSIVPGLPTDLVDLSLQLLARDPRQRPGAADVLGRIGVSSRSGFPLLSSTRSDAIIGRGAQVTALDEAFASTRQGQPVTLCLHGSSGAGKSALLQWFLWHRMRPAKAVVLQGRCYERESIPYKALDGVLDDLSWLLRALPAKQQAALITPDLVALARMFPVFEWLEASEYAAGGSEAASKEPVQLRRQAFTALRELLRRLAHTRPVVIHIDDLQWGDAESVVALEDLLSQQDGPAVLLVVTVRTEEIDAKPFLQSLVTRARSDRSGRVREVALGPLTEAETAQLVRRLLVRDQPEVAAHVQAIVAESHGIPFLAELLTRHVSTATAGDRATTGVSIEEMLDAQLQELPEGSRALLETVAVAARPIDSMVARDAAGLTGDERRLVRTLQSAHLLRATSLVTRIELYHDRLRETFARQIPRERLAGIHLSLARSLESHDVDEPEALSQHYFEAGQTERAGHYAARAANLAAESLAFERAAVLYRRALEMNPADPEAPALQVRLGESLANAGHGVEASTVYLAAVGMPGIDAVELRRRAVEHLLRCGHVKRALEVVDVLVRSVGLSMARSRASAIARLLMRRAHLRLRGLGFTSRSLDQIEPATLSRIDVCTTVSGGLARVDGLRATDFHSLGLLLALRAGEPFRIARAFGVEAAYHAMRGGPDQDQTDRLIELARTLAERVGSPRALGFAHLVRGMADNHIGRFTSSRPHIEVAERMFREKCVGAWMEIDVAQAHTFLSLYYTGELRELARRVPLRVQEAKDHDDFFAVADAMGRPNILWLAADDVPGARQALGGIRHPEAVRGFDWRDYLRLFAECQIDLYAGEGHRAWDRIASQWSQLAASTVMRLQSTRLEAFHLRARCALAAGERERDPRRYLKVANRDARRIARERMAWALPLVDLVLAACADARADRAAALPLMARAVSGFKAAGLAAYEAAAQYRYASLLSGTEEREVRARADVWMTSQGVVNPARIAGMLAPGFRE